MHAAGNQGVATQLTLAVQDVVAPAVAVSTPIDGAAEVSEAAPVTVQFSEPVNPADISASNVRLTSGATTIAAALALSESGVILTITPDAPLALATLHTVAIQNVRDAAANVIAPFTSTFTTRIRRW